MYHCFYMKKYYVVGRTNKDKGGKSYLIAEATCPFCQNKFQARKGNMVNAKSCGCMKGNKKHGMTRTRPYRAWRNMLNRCTDPNNAYWHRYGGRGIGVCDKWLSFEGFWSDMRKNYKSHLTLDRIDNNEGYHKENCRWATMEQQSKNKTNSIVYKGESARQAGIRINGNPSLVYQRLAAGMPKHKAFTLLSKRQKIG